jgi:hypothetical protein
MILTLDTPRKVPIFEPFDIYITIDSDKEDYKTSEFELFVSGEYMVNYTDDDNEDKEMKTLHQIFWNDVGIGKTTVKLVAKKEGKRDIVASVWYMGEYLGTKILPIIVEPFITHNPVHQDIGKSRPVKAKRA